MNIKKWVSPPQSVVNTVIDFLSYDKPDVDRFLANMDKTTIFTVTENKSIIGTISVIYKHNGKLPIEAGINSQNKPFVVPKNSVEVAGLKISANPSVCSSLLKTFNEAVHHETIHHHKYITCNEKLTGVYKRRGFSIIDTITFDKGKNFFMAMWKH
jgi:hypothetical protein